MHKVVAFSQVMIFVFPNVFSFLFFTKMKHGWWVGGIFFHYTDASVNVASKFMIVDFIAISTYLVGW